MKKLLLILAMVLMCGNAWADDVEENCRNTANNIYPLAYQVLQAHDNFISSLAYLEEQIKPKYSPQYYNTMRYAFVLLQFAPYEDNNDKYLSLLAQEQVEHLTQLCIIGERNIYNK